MADALLVLGDESAVEDDPLLAADSRLVKALEVAVLKGAVEPRLGVPAGATRRGVGGLLLPGGVLDLDERVVAEDFTLSVALSLSGLGS